MNGATLAIALALLLGGVGALAVVAGPGGMMGGSPMGQCAGMHPGATGGHMQCAQEVRAGTHAACDPMGMTAAECAAMESYMAGSGMTGPCH